MKSLWFALALTILLAPAEAPATAQFPDIIYIDGRKHSLYSNPLEKYFSRERSRPPFRSPNTANWRGYIAVWEIDRGRFYLKDLEAWLPQGKAGLEAVFPGHKGRVPATWFSGALRVPQGRMLKPVHMGYLSVYEKDLVIIIDKGKVVRQEVIDNTKTPQTQRPPQRFEPSLD
jgi:hypothetical protein